MSETGCDDGAVEAAAESGDAEAIFDAVVGDEEAVDDGSDEEAVDDGSDDEAAEDGDDDATDNGEAVSNKVSSEPVSERDISITLFGATDVGQLREHNEDNFLVADLTTRQRGVEGASQWSVGPNGLLLVVCDGMGGAAAGEVASQLAADIIFDHMLAAAGHDNRDQLALDVVEGLERAGIRILDESTNNRAFRGMGTTATVAALVDDCLLLGQVGDSRGYILREGRLVQVTRDQSLVNQLIEAGQLTEEEAEHFEHSNIILQALGTAEVVQVDLTFVDLCRGDVLLLCSDGLSGMIRDPEMRETLEALSDPEIACQTLIDDANMAGGHDNISLIIAVFDGESLRLPTDDDVAALKYQKYALPGWDVESLEDTAHKYSRDTYDYIYDDTPTIEITGEFEVGPDVDWDEVLAGRYSLTPREEPASSNTLMWVALVGLAVAIYLLLR